jgi:hypothetical protein
MTLKHKLKGEHIYQDVPRINQSHPRKTILKQVCPLSFGPGEQSTYQHIIVSCDYS